MVGNTGTYVDSPFHRLAHGKSLAELPLESLAEIPAMVVRPRLNGRRDIDATHFENIARAGRAVLVQTGWSRHWGTIRRTTGRVRSTRRFSTRIFYFFAAAASWARAPDSDPAKP
jgi:kynurenine formamidase